LLLALDVRRGSALGKGAILGLSIPACASETSEWGQVIKKYSPKSLQDEKQLALGQLNKLVSAAFNLDAADLSRIESDCAEDSFLRRIKPRYPGSVTRKQGFRTGLDASSRYGA